MESDYETQQTPFETAEQYFERIKKRYTSFGDNEGFDDNPLHIRMKRSVNDRIDQLIANRQFKDRSSACRYMLEFGLLAYSFKHEIKNPEFIKSVNLLKDGNKIFDWAGGLESISQIEGFILALQMEKEQRMKLGKFL